MAQIFQAEALRLKTPSPEPKPKRRRKEGEASSPWDHWDTHGVSLGQWIYK
jgi:hypothetical protein